MTLLTTNSRRVNLEENSKTVILEKTSRPLVLTHSFPMYTFSTLWKHQKTVRFYWIFSTVICWNKFITMFMNPNHCRFKYVLVWWYLVWWCLIIWFSLMFMFWLLFHDLALLMWFKDLQLKGKKPEWIFILILLLPLLKGIKEWHHQGCN